MSSRLTTRSFVYLGVPLWLGACATRPAPSEVSAPVPLVWQAALPHQGSLADLSQWWRQQGDPLNVIEPLTLEPLCTREAESLPASTSLELLHVPDHVPVMSTDGRALLPPPPPPQLTSTTAARTIAPHPEINRVIVCPPL